MLMKLTTGCQFHQHFTSAFLSIFWRKKISYSKHSFVIFGAKILYKKYARKMLMKLTPGCQFFQQLDRFTNTNVSFV